MPEETIQIDKKKWGFTAKEFIGMMTTLVLVTASVVILVNDNKNDITNIKSKNAAQDSLIGTKMNKHDFDIMMKDDKEANGLIKKIAKRLKIEEEE